MASERVLRNLNSECSGFFNASQSCPVVSKVSGEIFAWQLRGWVLVQEFNLSYHNKETILFAIDPY